MTRCRDCKGTGLSGLCPRCNGMGELTTMNKITTIQGVIRKLRREIRESRQLEEQETGGSPEAVAHCSYADGMELACKLLLEVLRERT